MTAFKHQMTRLRALLLAAAKDVSPGYSVVLAVLSYPIGSCIWFGAALCLMSYEDSFDPADGAPAWSLESLGWFVVPWGLLASPWLCPVFSVLLCSMHIVLHSRANSNESR